MFTPIAVGFLLNLLIFLLAKASKQTNGKSLLISFGAFVLVLSISFMIGSWVGIGISVLSLGMLLFLMVVGMILFLTFLRKTR